MDVDPQSIKANKIRLQIEHLHKKHELETRLRREKYEAELKKLELSLLQLESR